MAQIHEALASFIAANLLFATYALIRAGKGNRNV